MIQNKLKSTSTVLLVSLSENEQILKKMCFICDDKHISDKNTYNKDGIGRCKMDDAKEHLNEQCKYYESGKNSWFCDAQCRFNNLCIR